LATPANKPGVSIAPSIIPDKPGEDYADNAYDALSVEEAINAKGGTARPLRKGHRWLAAEKVRSAQSSAAAHTRLGRRALDKFPLYRFALRNLSRNALLARQDRDNLRNLETQLPFSLDAMDRACQGKIAGPSRAHCLQRQTTLAAAKRLSGFEKAQSKPGPSTKPKTSSPSRRSKRFLEHHDHPSHFARPNQPARRSRFT
jgi:hypothetical protein